MILAFIVGSALILLGGFLVLTALERKRGARVFQSLRAKLDKQVGRVVFIITHVDWSAFIKHVVRTASERVAHDVVHGTLVAVRFLERLLTRAVRALRERQSGARTLPRESRQRLPIRETLQKFRKSLAQVQAAQARKKHRSVE